MKVASFCAALLATTGIALAANSKPASAVTFGFNNITGGDTVGDAYNSNFSFDVSQSQSDSSKVIFKFLNSSPSTSTAAIKQFALSLDNSIAGLLSNIKVNVDNIGTVKFDSKVQNLPQSNLISGWVDEIFGGGTDGANKNSVQSGEVLGVSFTGKYTDVITALNTGKLQVGIHVGSLPINGASDSYISGNPSTKSVPEPATVFGLMAFGIGGFLTRRNGKNSKTKVIAAKVTV
ncbi:PEP-CTERM sorting domain-containing protein [Tolypothrix sp. PCC 7910]|uniref:PEP-CTERM sorting domain-containing protein n=1 Tax=Tolypothrix sp. PCC 7910 TaxID=2099387 RepID=UPI00142798D3|nr:PEP-CTERM sorting domain-containing protein [Tolypothrix sp. PCC 7910]QIR40064.1 PEP-CTERM sorting domain-containing protein [Tolypothrix sp. PCC 7910]